MNFWNDHGHDLEPFRTEWEVWSAAYKLAGSIDMVFRRKSDGKFLIYDWKRSKEIKTGNQYQTGLGPLSHLPDCNYWQYSLQLNVYRWILENLYDLDIAEMYLLILHPDNPNYKRMRLNRLDDEVDAMLNCRLNAVQMGCFQPVVLSIDDMARDLPPITDEKVLDELTYFQGMDMYWQNACYDSSHEGARRRMYCSDCIREREERRKQLTWLQR